MHLIGVRRELAEQHPWLPGAVFKAFEQSKTIALEKLADTSSTKVTLPFVEERLMEARALMGARFLALWRRGKPQDAGDLPHAIITRKACRRGCSRWRSCSTRHA